MPIGAGGLGTADQPCGERRLGEHARGHLATEVLQLPHVARAHATPLALHSKREERCDWPLATEAFEVLSPLPGVASRAGDTRGRAADPRGPSGSWRFTSARARTSRVRSCTNTSPRRARSRVRCARSSDLGITWSRRESSPCTSRRQCWCTSPPYLPEHTRLLLRFPPMAMRSSGPASGVLHGLARGTGRAGSPS